MNHAFFMAEAISIAEQGRPAVYPNPLVGCVIVHQNTIVAKGYHKKFGDHHAEVNAIKSLPESIPTHECVVYVSLEPCSHYGKTPPCADLIISKGFKNVVIGTQDPNPVVGGKGIQKLRDAGIEIVVGVLESEIIKQNIRFFTFHQKQRPYYILKWAQTSDGFISKWPVPENRSENQISRHEANKLVHELRANNMAVMIGKNTALADNPLLTVRHIKGKNPIRIVIDKHLETPRNFHIYNQEAPTIILNTLHNEVENDLLRFVKLDFNESIFPQMNKALLELNIQSVLVEGGNILLQSLIKKNIWDEMIIIENPSLKFDTGIKAPEIELSLDFEHVGEDKMYRLNNQMLLI